MTTTEGGFDIDAALDQVLETTSTPSPGSTEKPAPYVAAIPVDALFADHTYQRELDERRVDKMAHTYQVALVGIIEVSARPDGRYAVLDGQHRWACVRNVHATDARPPSLPCRVHTGLTSTEEAVLYHQLNTTRKQLTGWDRWVARRAAGDQAVLDIEACAHRHDYRVDMREKPAVIRATRALENITNLGGIRLLDRVLDVVRAAYSDDQTALDGAILGGIAHILNSYTTDELDTARLIECLSGIVPRQLAARAVAQREIHRGTNDRLTAHVIIERYNTTTGPKVEAFFSRMKPSSKTPKVQPVDQAVVTRALAGEQVVANQAERREIVRRWADSGQSLSDLERQTGWKTSRYLA